MRKYCIEENLTITDILHLADDSCTYLSEAHGPSLWTDHLVSTIIAHSLVENMQMKYDYITSDHHPTIASLYMKSIQLQSSQDPTH